jgi:secreted trypsin-like serine protease
VNGKSYLSGLFNSSYYPACADNWSAAWSSGVCRSLGQGAPVSTTIIPFVSNVYILVNSSSYNVTNIQLTSTCSNIIRLVCMDPVCGTSAGTSSYIVNGDIATFNAWPWAAVLQYNGNYRCSAVLLGSGWLMTAAHCFREDNGFSLANLNYRFTVRMQTTQRTGFDPWLKVFGVKRIVVHPNYTAFSNGVQAFDLALVQLGNVLLAPAVNMSSTPVCLPSTILNTAAKQTLQCYAVGWGLSNPDNNGKFQ